MKKVTSILLLIFLIFTLSACGNSENKAKKDLETYLEAMKTGDDDTVEDYLDADENLFDVFSYKYLRTIEEDSDEKDGDYYTFLYDTKIANKGGEELHRKIEFEVEKGYDDHYVVSNITIRGYEEDDEDY